MNYEYLKPGWYISTNEKGRFDQEQLLTRMTTETFLYQKIIYAPTRDKLLQKIKTMYPKAAPIR